MQSLGIVIAEVEKMSDADATADDVDLLRSFKRAMETMPEKTIEIRDSYVRWMNYVYTDPLAEIDKSVGILTERSVPYTAVTDGAIPLSSTENSTVPLSNTATSTPVTTADIPETTAPTYRTRTDPTGVPRTPNTNTTQSPVDRNHPTTTETDLNSSDNRTMNRRG